MNGRLQLWKNVLHNHFYFVTDCLHQVMRALFRPYKGQTRSEHSVSLL